MKTYGHQIELLKLAGAEKIFQEKFTGTTTERPEFQKLLRALKTGDTLIVTKLDRFARNTREALSKSCLKKMSKSTF